MAKEDVSAKPVEDGTPKQQVARWICPRCTFGNIREATECAECRLPHVT
jgi:hypothetical protein